MHGMPAFLMAAAVPPVERSSQLIEWRKVTNGIRPVLSETEIKARVGAMMSFTSPGFGRGGGRVDGEES